MRKLLIAAIAALALSNANGLSDANAQPVDTTAICLESVPHLRSLCLQISQCVDSRRLYLEILRTGKASPDADSMAEAMAQQHGMLMALVILATQQLLPMATAEQIVLNCSLQ